MEKKRNPINCSLHFLQDAFHSIVKEDTEKNRISDRTGIGQSFQGRGCLRVVSRLDVVKPGYLSVPLQKLP